MSEEISYFELQAYVGTTKHMGGLEATRTLIQRCAIGAGTYVLDVGCGKDLFRYLGHAVWTARA